MSCAAWAFGSVAEAAEGLTRSAWRMSVLPALALPQSIRGPLFDGVRCWTATLVKVSPPPIARIASGLAADLDDMEGPVARREDLGSRLRRERRRAARSG